ncbi:hypothetical protein RRG08_045851 [Elysia crispata]|uniref:Uncharacterized protein n=1 Tax=Elysia crispata TaxID=231223 RepID=A0AAE1B2M5_9GAST|nr:hypothetical protein RRG08_045851 [Elysia crispata]
MTRFLRCFSKHQWGTGDHTGSYSTVRYTKNSQPSGNRTAEVNCPELFAFGDQCSTTGLYIQYQDQQNPAVSIERILEFIVNHNGVKL